ncbi:hypothetical protein niasHS_017379 [Heterodera schachtii]|uniref:Uncharacterized protein n=1 Tax=Heterodera schachtii TaxID=97005 RepID=A0ABD2HY88_HETSC
MSFITKAFLLLILLVAISFRFSASTGGKKNSNDGNDSNAPIGIGTKIKRIVTAGLLFTSLATGGAGAIQRSNVQGGNATGLLNSQMPNRTMVRGISPPPPPPELTPFQKAEAIIDEHAKKHNYNAWWLNASERVSPGGPDPHHHMNDLDDIAEHKDRLNFENEAKKSSNEMRWDANAATQIVNVIKVHLAFNNSSEEFTKQRKQLSINLA